jgi:hypothetical protein
MLRRIYILVLAVVVAAIGASGLAAFWIIRSYHSQVNEEFLNNAAMMIEQRLLAGDSYQTAAAAASDIFRRDEMAIRVTLIRPDGQVVFDTTSDSSQMENHLYRPEVQAALQSQGTGLSVHRSNTLDYDMAYLARYSPQLNLLIRTAVANNIERSGYLHLVTHAGDRRGTLSGRPGSHRLPRAAPDHPTAGGTEECRSPGQTGGLSDPGRLPARR